AINSQTPYAQILGSGDGSFDLYSFTVTQDMITPPSSTTSASSTTARGPFYASVGLTLNGIVREGDTWTLGIGHQHLTYTVAHGDTLTLLAVAQQLRGQLVTLGYTAQAVDLGGGAAELDIQNPAGFSLNGVNLNGLAQIGSSQGRITRSIAATQA